MSWFSDFMQSGGSSGYYAHPGLSKIMSDPNVLSGIAGGIDGASVDPVGLGLGSRIDTLSPVSSGGMNPLGLAGLGLQMMNRQRAMPAQTLQPAPMPSPTGSMPMAQPTNYFQNAMAQRMGSQPRRRGVLG